MRERERERERERDRAVGGMYAQSIDSAITCVSARHIDTQKELSCLAVII